MGECRVVIYGNAGSGKTTMARSLALPVLSLDDIAWTAAGVARPGRQPGRARAVHGRARRVGDRGVLRGSDRGRGRPLHGAAVLESGADVCVANAQRRPWEPTYCESPEEQRRLLGPLIAFIRDYEHMAGEWAWPGTGRSSRPTPAASAKSPSKTPAKNLLEPGPPTDWSGRRLVFRSGVAYELRKSRSLLLCRRAAFERWPGRPV